MNERDYDSEVVAPSSLSAADIAVMVIALVAIFAVLAWAIFSG